MNLNAPKLQRRQCLWALAGLALARPVWSETAGYKTIEWNDLMPDDWVKEMTKEMAAMSKLNGLLDGSQEATKAMDDLRKKLDNAPIVKSQVNQKVRLPGYAVPLDADRNSKREFLLVPYFGACIHVPPPPPNQIVYVKMAKGVALDSIYEAYWITGRMKTTNKTTRLGAAAYQLDATKVEIYKY